MSAGMEPAALIWGTRAERDERTGWRADNLRKSFTPQTVIDVGVARGTPGLYGAFPNAHYVLIEPLAEYETRLQELPGEYHLAAVGAQEGSVVLHVDEEAPALSSVHSLTHARRHATKPLAEREVPLTTLDALRASCGWRPPFGLKIDTEGSEDQVVMGAGELLKETQFVIAEVNVAPRFADSYSFAEFIALMDSHGFALCDLLDGLKRHPDGELIFVDAVFKR